MPASVAIIDYGSGNLRSVSKAFEAVAQGAAVTITDEPAKLAAASHIVLPGVGAYADCMRGLKAVPGMLAALEAQVHGAKKPFLGICVGMQMLFEEGHEHGVHPGLGWLKGKVVKLQPQGALKIPQMGWNELEMQKQHVLLNGVAPGAHAYFVHSYHAQAHPENLIATVNYGQSIAAVVGQGHIAGTQFHPEKSQQTGLALIRNFINQ
ncbi:MAG: imidazole glycerol phosphate synthase subunit HisH [Proteobacteria bacterium]|nr:imidazole glycerol phosphate synthase subunit HisH [Pseudomonadota bacterium]